MLDAAPINRSRPIGLFVHHQGRGHMERAADLANALPSHRPVTLFCARTDGFPALRSGVKIVTLPSLFEKTGEEPDTMDWVGTPDVFHCAPLGWSGIRTATAQLAGWFADSNPALFISDVSAELALFARICSVPHVMVLQHGDRSDPGHRAAYDSAAGLLAPYDQALAQLDWTAAMRAKTCFAGGLGVRTWPPGRAEALAQLGLDPTRKRVVILTGGGGTGVSQAAIAVGARAFPDTDWITIGPLQRDWHATEPANLSHQGWVTAPERWIAAADLAVSSTGNTTCHQIMAAGIPWLAIPEWRYFDEQLEKARALDRAGVAVAREHIPSSAHAWRSALAAACTRHDPGRMRGLTDDNAANHAAQWIEALIARLWTPGPPAIPALEGYTL